MYLFCYFQQNGNTGRKVTPTHKTLKETVSKGAVFFVYFHIRILGADILFTLNY